MITNSNAKTKKGNESEGTPISNAKPEPFDLEVHIGEIVDKAMRELYDLNRPAEPLYVSSIIYDACEKVFRKALRLSGNELAKQLAETQEALNAMLIGWT